MSKEQTKDLVKFLKTFDKETIDIVTWLRDFAWGFCPQSNELIYDNYNAVSLGWSVTDKVAHNICSVVIYRANQNVHFGFIGAMKFQTPTKFFWEKASSIATSWCQTKRNSPKHI